MSIRIYRLLVFAFFLALVVVPPVGADSPYTKIAGLWDGHNWKDVLITGKFGLYEDRWGFPYGILEFEHIADDRYRGFWAESAGRNGTMEIRLLSDNSTIVGTYSSAATVRRGSKKEDKKIYWLRKADSEKEKAMLSKADLDFSDLSAYVERLAKLRKEASAAKH